jgi:hypothetical protein
LEDFVPHEDVSQEGFDLHNLKFNTLIRPTDNFPNNDDDLMNSLNSFCLPTQRTAWTKDEDKLLLQLVAQFTISESSLHRVSWREIAQAFDGSKSKVSCRKRYERLSKKQENKKVKKAKDIQSIIDEEKGSHLMDESVNYSTASTLATHQFNHSTASLFTDDKNNTFLEMSDLTKMYS